MSARASRSDDTIWFKSSLDNGYAWLSNFWSCVSPSAFNATLTLHPYLTSSTPSYSFTLSNTLYPTVEHYYQSSKYPLDPPYSTSILTSPHPLTALHLSTQYFHSTHLSPPLSSSDLSSLMLTGLRAKFHHPLLRRALLETGEREVWEVGDGRKGKWAGKGGELGKLIMQVRQELRREGSRSDTKMR